MMTRFSNPRYTYLRKVMFLPLVLVLFGLLSFRVESAHPKVILRLQKEVESALNATTVSVSLPRISVTPRKASTRPGNDTVIHDLVLVQEATREDIHKDTVIPNRLLPGLDDSVLIFVDGKAAPRRELGSINPNDIESISVLKGETAIAKYGAYAGHGVIEIHMKGTQVSGNVVQVNTVDNIIFTKVEVEAAFPGGDAAWNDYVRQTIMTHMDELQAQGLSGTAEIEFIVGNDGSVRGVHALTMQDSKLAQICVAAIANGPNWVPAQQNGHNVTSFRRQKITFEMPSK